VETYGPLHVREIRPKDFYFAQILRSKDSSMTSLVERVILNQEVMDEIPARYFAHHVKWISENVLDQKVLTVENWLEIGFHLCKQRWDQSMDWLENQPMSKIMAMIDIVKRHGEEQEKQAKKASRGKK